MPSSAAVAASVWGLLLAGGATIHLAGWFRRRRRSKRGAERFEKVALSDSVADWESFRRSGKDMVDFICDYYEEIEKYPVRAQVRPGYLQERLEAGVGENGESWRAIMRDVERHIVPGMTHWQSPRFFAYYPANTSPPALMGEMVSSMFNAIGFSWEASPAATELETIVMDNLAGFIGLPACFSSHGAGGGVVQGTASEAVLVALLAARGRAARVLRVTAEAEAAAAASADGAKVLPLPSETELFGRMTLYTSDQAHSCVKKAAMIAGLESGLRLVTASAGNNFAVNADNVAAAMAADAAAGLVPMFVCCNVGTTSSCAVDPVRAIAKAARRYESCWVHVDAAYAGAAACCPEYRAELMDGTELVDSFCFNPHKWLLTNFDFSALFVRERSHLLRALSVTPEILRSSEYDSGLVHDYRDWQVPLGRKFRALKLWFVLRSYGAHRIREYIRGHCALAATFAALVEADDRWEVVAPPKLGLVCFRLKGDDSVNRGIRDAVAAGGNMFLVNTVLGGRYVLRFAVGSPRTEERHVLAAWKELQRHADSIRNENSHSKPT